METEAKRVVRYKTDDCPDANGRQPLVGELKWTLSFRLEDGTKLELQIGEKCRRAFKAMLAQEEIDDTIGIKRQQDYGNN